MAVKVKVHAAGLLNYAKAGKEAVQKVRKAMYRVLNTRRDTKGGGSRGHR